MDKPFDVFRQELARVNMLSSASLSSQSSPSDILLPSTALKMGTSLLERPLANVIAWPLLRRFTNRFLVVVLDEVPRLGGRKDFAARRVAFDVALLAYLYHVVAEAGAMNLPHKFAGMIVKGVLRKVTGQEGFIMIQIQKQLDKYALPWILNTVTA